MRAAQAGFLILSCLLPTALAQGAAGEAQIRLERVLGARGRGDAQLMNPTGLAASPDGAIWIADSGNRRVQIVSPQGEFLRQIGARRPSNAPDEPMLERADRGAQGAGPGRQGGGAGVGRPDAIALAPDGTVYLADTQAHRVTALNPEGQLLAQWGGIGAEPGRFNRPSGVAVAPDGNVYVTDELNHRVQKFTPDGRLMRYWGSHGAKDGQMDLPWGVAVDALGDVWVCDWRNDRIQVFSHLGEHRRSIVGADAKTTLRRPAGVAFDSDGVAWALSSETGELKAFSREGRCLGETGPLGADRSGPAAIAIAPEDRIYIADSLQSRISVFARISRPD